MASASTLLQRMEEPSRLHSRERRRLLALTEQRRMEPGELLFSQGEAADHLVLVLSGSLEVTVQIADGGQLALGRSGPGEVLGEMGLLDGAPRSATAICKQRALLLVLPRERYRALAAQADPLACWVLRIAARGLSARIGDMMDRIAAAALDPTLLRGVPQDRDERARSWWSSLRLRRRS